MSNLNVYADEIAKKCISAYYNLPKNGKPVEKEWTVLSCIVQNNKLTDDLKVISVGTGSKCIGASKLSPRGNILNDSHAEVLARRAFLVYLYDNLKITLEGENTIFVREHAKFKLKEHFEYYFYASQLPCGDACIMPKLLDTDHIGYIVEGKKRPAEDSISNKNAKKQKMNSGDIHRTGAKCLPHAEQDIKDSGENYHLLGQVRTKPGRGDPTLSVSCSDKMSRWIHLGVQGGLLDMLLSEPILIKAFIFGGGVPYTYESIERALLKRNPLEQQVNFERVPDIQQCSIVFPQVKTKDNYRPAPASIASIEFPLRYAEAVVQGRKLGATKKAATLLSNSPFISKYKLYKRFLEILTLLGKDECKSLVGEENIDQIPYNEMKKKSKKYAEKWLSIKNQFFKTWTVKPDLWNFCADVTKKTDNN